MAHFAKLKQEQDPFDPTKQNWVVEQVVVVDNKHVSSDESEDGEIWCSNYFNGGNWKQTSYNNNFRKKYAAIGDVYDFDKNKFIAQQPFASWSLDANDDWQPPVNFPSIDSYSLDGKEVRYIISWDEENQKWIGKKGDLETFNWDPLTLNWIET